jgi:hypothetical protein
MPASNNTWLKYAGLGTQLIVGLLLVLFVGQKLDHFLGLHSLLSWIFPSIFILFTLYRIIKDTQPK